jgi:acyl carrier protein
MDTFNKIREIIAQNFDIEIERIKPESTFEELDMDSMDMFQLVFLAESELQIVVKDLPEGAKTIQDVIDAIEKSKA